jgi:hypothetical protein
MNFVPEVAEQREKEAKGLKRFLPFSFTGAIVLHLLLIPLFVLFWKPLTQPTVAEEEIEIIAEDQPDEPPPENESATDAGGSSGGNEQFSLFNLS